jgi:hypothetical protein
MKMNSRRAAILVFFLTIGWLCLPAESRPQGEQASDPGVAKVTRILEELKDNDRQSTVPNKTYELTEEELNAYLSAQLLQQNQKAVESINLLIKEGTFLTRVEVNADELDIKGDDVTIGYLRFLLRGTQTLEVEGKLQAAGAHRLWRLRENCKPQMGWQAIWSRRLDSAVFLFPPHGSTAS